MLDVVHHCHPKFRPYQQEGGYGLNEDYPEHPVDNSNRPVMYEGPNRLFITEGLGEEIFAFSPTTKAVLIDTEELPYPLARLFGYLKEAIVTVTENAGSQGISLDQMTLQLHCIEENVMEQDAWTALEDLLSCVPSLAKLEIMRWEPIHTFTTVPAAFLLSLRQNFFDLELSLDAGVDPERLIHDYLRQTQHSPLLSPFAIGSILTENLSLSEAADCAGLGRAGPGEFSIYANGEGNDNRGYILREEGDNLEVLGGLRRNFWLEWPKHPDRPWLEPDEPDGKDLAEEMETTKWFETLNRRNRHLRISTRSAATSLLQSARPFLLSRPSASHPSNPSDSRQVDPSFSLGHSRSISHPLQTSSNSTSPSPITSSYIFPILSLPYEVLDTILSCVSPGCLSSKQHRIIMNWAEDRSTLGIKKADSRTDFLRKTNCWRWESEYERVNLGLGYGPAGRG